MVAKGWPVDLEGKVELDPGGDRQVRMYPENEAPVQMAATVRGGTELGSQVSVSPWTGFTRQEHNPELRAHKGLLTYDRMERSDPAVRSSLRLARTPVLSARWYMEPASDSNRDRKIADRIFENLTEGLENITWDQFLFEALLMLQYGYYMFEIVYEKRNINGRTRTEWKKLAPRHPLDVNDFRINDKGEVTKVLMSRVLSSYLSPGNGNSGFGVPTGMSDISIPASKLIFFTFDQQGGDVTGTSLLRSAYKPWYYLENLYKIDAIQKERHGIQVPYVVLPPNYNVDDKKAADELGRNLRTNERAHVTVPPGWEVGFLEMSGNPVDTIASIRHHEKQMWVNVMASFIAERSATSDEYLIDLYLKASKYIADIIASTINHQAIKPLMDYNYSNPKYPKLRVRHIGEARDWRTFSFALRNMVGSSVVKPDDELESVVRNEMDLPPADEDTAREVATPQSPGDEGGEGEKQRGSRVGAPRQSPAPSVGTGSANTGDDRSGGS